MYFFYKKQDFLSMTQQYVKFWLEKSMAILISKMQDRSVKLHYRPVRSYYNYAGYNTVTLIRIFAFIQSLHLVIAWTFLKKLLTSTLSSEFAMLLGNVEVAHIRN